MELTLKNVKVHEALSEETYCFTASMYVDGRRAGSVSNRGCGGPHEFDWLNDPKLGAAYEKWVSGETIFADDPSEPGEKMEITGEFYSKVEWMIDMALERALDQQWFKRQCRGKVLFRLKGDDDTAWRTLKLRKGGKYTSETKAWMVEKYGDKLGEIANETRV